MSQQPPYLCMTSLMNGSFKMAEDFNENLPRMNHCFMRSKPISGPVFFPTKCAHVGSVSLTNTRFGLRLFGVDAVGKMSPSMVA